MNLKKLKEGLIAFVLLIFSFFYTNKAVELVQQADPIMKQIKASDSKYKVEAENALIVGDKIIPGQNGLEVDYQESYQKMKKYGSYNEALTTLKEIKPTISVNDYYDKYVVTGNSSDREVALIFKIDKASDILNLTPVLDSKNASATFFIDGAILENNLDSVLKLSNYEVELLNYNGKYNRDFFINAKNYLEDITKREAKYCYLDYDNEEVINLCSSLKMHTVMPSIKVLKNAYAEIKAKLSNSAIITIPSSISQENLSITLDYLKNRGYRFLFLDTLISESLEK